MDRQPVRLTQEHPFYQKLKSYPKCFNIMTRNKNGPCAFFCRLNPNSIHPTTSRSEDGSYELVVFTKDGAHIYRPNDNSLIVETTSDWEIIKPYVENAEYICYS